MKKLLLSFVALFTCIALSAATFNWADVFGSETKNISTWTSGDFTFTAAQGTGATPPAYNKAGDLRLYAANTLTISAKTAMTKIVFTLASNDARYTSISASTGSVSAQAAGDTEVTWTGSATEVTFTVKDGATAFGTETGKPGQFRFSAMDITGGGDAGTVVTPEPEAVDNIGAWLAKADAANNVTVKGTATAVYQNGTSLFIKDNTGWVLVYGAIDQTYNNGDVIPGGFGGTFYDYNGLPEMNKPTGFAAGTPGTPVEPEEIIADDLNATPLSAYVKLTGVTIGEVGENNNYPATDGSADFTIHNSFKNVSVPAGEDMTVYGFVSIYKGAYQITPILVENASGRQTVATPYFTPAAGEIYEGTEVTIACSTPDAKIYYTLDGTEPTTASTLYTAGIPVNAAVTIKAFAVADGMDDSAVAVAEYTVKQPLDLGDAVVFMAPDCKDVKNGIKLINKDGSTTASANNDEAVSLTGETFNGANVDITFVQGEGIQFYTGAYGDAVRWMQGNIIEVKPANGYKVTQIFVQTAANSKGAFEATVNGTVTGIVTGEGTGVANPITWTGDAEGTLVLTSLKQVRFKYIAITLADSGSVDAIAADDANAPVEYYNLQGVRVANPANGLYIRVAGNKATKVRL